MIAVAVVAGVLAFVKEYEGPALEKALPFYAIIVIVPTLAIVLKRAVQDAMRPNDLPKSE